MQMWLYPYGEDFLGGFKFYLASNDEHSDYIKKLNAQHGVSNNPKHVSINLQRAAPTEYSGSCRRKKQARTSSQWKVPLWVPIFVTVMFSVQSLFGSLDM